MMLSNFIIAFIFTLIAGLATCIGGLLVTFINYKNFNYISILLGLSSGILIVISLIQLYSSSLNSFLICNNNMAYIYSSYSLLVGMFICYIINIVLPNKSYINNMNYSTTELELYKVGILSMITVVIHNFPEGIITFMTTINNPKVGLPIAFAIAVHNIPEGIMISTPIYYSTKSKRKALKYSFLSGISEPVGALCAYMFLYRFMNAFVFGVVYGVVAGVMIFITFNNILPMSYKIGNKRCTVFGIIIGIQLMLLSKVLFV